MLQRSQERGLPDAPRSGSVPDRLEVLQRRTQIFHERTMPIIEYYEYCHRLLTINGEQPPDIVTQEILEKLNCSS